MALKDGKNIVPQKWCLKAGQDASKCADGSNTYTLEMPFVANTTYKGIAYVDNVAYESTTSYTTTTIAPTQRIEFMITIPTTTPEISTTDYKVRVVENVNGKQVGVSGVHVSVFTGGIPPIEINGAGKATDVNGYVTLNLSSTGSYSAGVIISSTYNATNNISLNKGTENILVVSKKQTTETNPNSGGNSTTGGQQSTTPQLPDGTWLGTWNQNANDGFSALGNVELRNKTTLTVNGGEEGLECLGGQSTFTISDVTTNSNGQINFSGGGISYTITSSTAAKMSGIWSTTSNCLIKSGGWEMYKR